MPIEGKDTICDGVNMFSGGSAGNTAIALAALSLETNYYAAIGKVDIYGFE